MAGAGVPASIADRAAIVAALQVLCALPECARGALNARGFIAGFRPHRNCRNWEGSGMRCMPAHQDAWRHARMKRSGAELPLEVHLQRVRRSPQRGGSRDCQARWRWRRAPLRVVKMCQHHQRHGVLLASSAAAYTGRQSTGCCMWCQSVGC